MSYVIKVYGKATCGKCKILKDKIAKLLPEYPEVEMQSVDILEPDGMVDFCKMEELNPGSIPAFVLFRKNESGIWPLHHTLQIVGDPAYADLPLKTALGLQTDYSSTGAIPEKYIVACLDKAVGKGAL